MPTRTKKRYLTFHPRIGDAAALQRRVAAGEATPAETRQYQRIITTFRRKFANGQLSPQTARQFGIE